MNSRRCGHRKEIKVANTTNMGYDSPAGDALAENAKKMTDTITDTAGRAAEKSRELGRTAMDKIEEGRQSAANSLQSAASALHQTADNLPGVEKAGNLTHSTAEKLEAVAGYMR